MIGDSITEQKQYSVFIENYLLMCRPAADLRATQFGWGGETSWGFLARMEFRTLSKKLASRLGREARDAVAVARPDGGDHEAPGGVARDLPAGSLGCRPAPRLP